MQEMTHYVTQVAEENGWILNPDEHVAKKVIRGLANAAARFGLPYCPCSIRRDGAMVCPCQNVWSDMATVGHCNCRLYYTREDDVKEVEESV